MRALDLFAGPGGWSLAAEALGIEEWGVEIDPDARATRDAAGFITKHDDVWTVPEVDEYDLLIASPPCQTFSLAGSGSGREALEAVLQAVRDGSWLDIEDLRKLGREVGDERTALVLTPLYFANRDMPRYIALEQVPTVLPVWEAIAGELRCWGYSVWTGVLHAEQYGTPQTRKRAFLMASLEGEVAPPTPTHSKFHNRTPERLDEGVLPWVSMAEALGWTGIVGFPRLSDGREEVEINGVAYRARDMHDTGRPAPVVTEKARSWKRYNDQPVTHMGDVVQQRGTVRHVNEPSATITSAMDNGNWRWAVDQEGAEQLLADRINNQSGTTFDWTWPWHRPAPTIAGREIVTNPGANANRYNGSTKSRNDGLKVEPWEAGVLQSFPVDFPWQGTRTKRFQQVGNAIPPRLAYAVLRALVCKSGV